MKQLKKDIIDNKYILLILAVILGTMQIAFGTICPFKAFFNIDCPGCGLTRACLSFLTFHFAQSFAYNPTAILWMLAIGLSIFNRYIYKLRINSFPFLYIIASIVTIFVYVYKML